MCVVFGQVTEQLSLFVFNMEHRTFQRGPMSVLASHPGCHASPQSLPIGPTTSSGVVWSWMVEVCMNHTIQVNDSCRLKTLLSQPLDSCCRSRSICVQRWLELHGHLILESLPSPHIIWPSPSLYSKKCFCLVIKRRTSLQFMSGLDLRTGRCHPAW